ncbi:MAG: hypothetical protein WAT47_13990 [Nostocoides sp.]
MTNPSRPRRRWSRRVRVAVIPGRGHIGYAAPRESRETCLIDGSRYAI